MRSWMVSFVLGLSLAQMSAAQEEFKFDAPDSETDQLVEMCLETDGVSMLEGTDVICYNST